MSRTDRSKTAGFQPAGKHLGYLRRLGDLVNRPDDPGTANTRAALQEIVPVDGPATCLEWANQIKSRFGTWLDNRRTLLTEKLPQLADAQVNDVLTLALFTAATRLYNSYQSQGAGQGLVPEGPGPGGEDFRASKSFRAGFPFVGPGSRVIGESIRRRHRRFCARLHADDCPDYPGLADYAPLRVLSIRRGHQSSAGNACTGHRLLRRDLVGEELDVVSRVDQSPARSAVWVSGGFTLTDEFALAGTGLVNLTNNVAWAYLFLVILTPVISYALFFGRLGNLAALRFRFVGLSTLTRIGTRVVS